MKNVIKAIKDYYDGRLARTSDFEHALKECTKEELIEFIIAHQCRGCFKGVVHE